MLIAAAPAEIKRALRRVFEAQAKPPSNCKSKSSKKAGKTPASQMEVDSEASDVEPAEPISDLSHMVSQLEGQVKSSNELSYSDKEGSPTYMLVLKTKGSKGQLNGLALGARPTLATHPRSRLSQPSLSARPRRPPSQPSLAA